MHFFLDIQQECMYTLCMRINKTRSKKMELPESVSVLERMRQSRLDKLHRIGPVLAGSLMKRKDQTGYYLTDKVRGKTRTTYVSEEMYAEAKQWNANHKEAKQLLDELSEIQRVLLREEGKAKREPGKDT